MKLNRIAPLLRVHDLENGRAFYRDVLGFLCVHPIEGCAWLKKDGVELMLALPKARTL
jgi:catechol 2,3-dioxygenase-like lactoylglutathione lyase family enzyme